MKRKEFLASAAALVAAPFVIKADDRDTPHNLQKKDWIRKNPKLPEDCMSPKEVLDKFNETGMLLYNISIPRPVWPCFTSAITKHYNANFITCTYLTHVRKLHIDGKWYLITCRTNRTADSGIRPEVLQIQTMQDFTRQVWIVQNTMKVDPTIKIDGYNIYPCDSDQRSEDERILSSNPFL